MFGLACRTQSVMRFPVPSHRTRAKELPIIGDTRSARARMDTREFLVEFTLRNACVAIFNDHFTKYYS